jgi:hypothetical protein
MLRYEIIQIFFKIVQIWKKFKEPAWETPKKDDPHKRKKTMKKNRLINQPKGSRTYSIWLEINTNNLY